MTNVPPAPPQPPIGAAGMPPMPRDIGPSDSEIIPLRSTKINILKSGILIPLGVTAAVCITLFSLSNFYQMMYVFSGYLLFCIFYAAYVYSGIRKSIFVYLIPFVIVYVELTTSLLSTFIFVFRTILPGGEPKSPGFVSAFISMFFGAGLMEELMKAIPALIGLSIALRVPNDTPNTQTTRYLDWLRVSTPLEGLMLGLAAGAGFIFVETLYQYVPNMVEQVTAKSGAGAGFANGFALLLPRVLHGVIGHMAWAGISGYFIGLVARYPRSIIKLLAIGWLLPATLHALWNSSSHLGGMGIWIAGAITLFVFVGCFLKAKQLEAVRQGRAFVSTDSIIVGGVPLPVASGTIPEKNTTAWGGLSQVVAAFFQPKVATAPAGAFPVGMPAAAAPAGLPMAPQAAVMPRFTLSNGAERYGIVPGQTIDLAMLFPGRGISTGALAEVTAHPQDPQTIGLKNMTTGTWAVKLDTGASTEVAPGRNVKLVANEKIKIGDVIIDVQAV
jgi:RsiW-degrading membrane proteinase PrsW (M82 family)